MRAATPVMRGVNTACQQLAAGQAGAALRTLRELAASQTTRPNGQKTVCPKGHPLSGDNVYSRPGTTWRECKTCKKEYARRRRGGMAVGIRRYAPGGVNDKN